MNQLGMIAGPRILVSERIVVMKRREFMGTTPMPETKGIHFSLVAIKAVYATHSNRLMSSI
jgi:hypothetical protein